MALSNLSHLIEQVRRVSDIYTTANGIMRDRDWYLLKIGEEFGELTQAYLRCTSRARQVDIENVHTALENEASDLLCHLLLFADINDLDLEAAIRRKWLSYLE
jgi:NTP pyrophosphatase (non-canonical NTP hydrolase)